jgi:diguanylate cyclase (GGDEF)-like protein
MGFWHRLAGARKRQPLPPEIYCSLVDALFKDSRSLLVGSLAAAGTALITAWKTGEPSLYSCSLAMLAVSCLRAVDMRAFARNREQVHTSDQMRPWEQRYVVGAAAHVALMGIWCLLAFTKTVDPFVQIFSFSMTLAYMIGISGRNFASNLLVTAQIVCAGIPMTIALASVGGEYYTVFAFVLVPFFAALKFISDRLRRVLLDAVIASRDVSLLAGRFDTALNNMPHGLCMFDVERRLVVSNRRLSALLSVPTDLAGQRVSAPELIARCALAGSLTEGDADRLSRQFEEQLAGSTAGEAFVETRAGRALALTFHPMASGGAVVLFEDITERMQAEARINQLVRYDTLTGLPNRAAFREHIDAAVTALRRRGPFAIQFVDLDEFNQVNDTLGHPCGDELLCAAADRLRNAVRSTDVVCRFGGDEFVVLQYPFEHASEAAALAERIGDALAEPFRVSGHDVVISASIGIALAPRDGDDADALLKNADMALNRAKSDGGRMARFFEQRMDVMAQARRNLQLDVRTALACNTLEVHYQPLLNLRSKRISTCEALLRWHHPQRGMISPAEFIPAAEEMGLIVEIGKFVLNEACLQCTTWPGETRIAVNVSPMQFRRGNLVEAIREALQSSGLSPGRLEIEITESVFLSDTEVARHLLDQMQEIGVRVSLDDFGTGYSSLSYLHRYPLNKVKIDRSFLNGVDSNQRQLNLLHGVARLSADLGMSVAVEGIETEEQLALVAQESSVEEVQGFLIGRAIPNNDIRTRLLAATAELGRVA